MVMARPAYNLHLHIIEDGGGDLITKVWAWAVPNVGDEVRLDGDTFYRVTRVVHVYDEDCGYHRANIGVEAVK
jgi:hypothetical protein